MACWADVICLKADACMPQLKTHLHVECIPPLQVVDKVATEEELLPLDGSGPLPPARSLPVLGSALPAPPPPAKRPGPAPAPPAGAAGLAPAPPRPAPPAAAAAGTSAAAQPSGSQPAAKRQRAAGGAFDAERLQVKPPAAVDVSKSRNLAHVKLNITWAELQAICSDSFYKSYAADLDAAFASCLDVRQPQRKADTRPPPADAASSRERTLYHLKMKCTAADVLKAKKDAEVNRLLPLLKRAARQVLKRLGGSSYNPRRCADSSESDSDAA